MKTTKKDSSIVLFGQAQIRRHWDEQQEKWFFSVIDIVGGLTESKNPQVYWRVLKKRLLDEGANETVTKCNGLKMTAADGKQRVTDVADTETMLRIIQSIPSPNAEPFKAWLAQVGYERIEETEDPEKAIDRAMLTYIKKGYSTEWINQRLKSIEVRKELTDEWKARGVQDKQYAILTEEITEAWAGMSTKQYKSYKGLKKQNLRDHMTNLELVLNMLAETATTEIARKKDAQGFFPNRDAAREGGTIAGNTRKQIEEKTSQKVVSRQNYLGLGGKAPKKLKK